MKLLSSSAKPQPHLVGISHTPSFSPPTWKVLPSLVESCLFTYGNIWFHMVLYCSIMFRMVPNISKGASQYLIDILFKGKMLRIVTLQTCIASQECTFILVLIPRIFFGPEIIWAKIFNCPKFFWAKIILKSLILFRTNLPDFSFW